MQARNRTTTVQRKAMALTLWRICRISPPLDQSGPRIALRVRSRRGIPFDPAGQRHAYTLLPVACSLPLTSYSFVSPSGQRHWSSPSSQ